MKKKVAIILILLMNLLHINAFAYSNETYKNVISYRYLTANHPDNIWNTDAIRVDFKSNVRYISAEIYSNGQYIAGLDITRADTLGLNCNGYWYITAYDTNRNSLGVDQISVTEIVNQSSACENDHSEGDTGKEPPAPEDPDPDPNPPPGGSEPDPDPPSCEACIFECPGWSEYMGKIDEIIGAIPPPPNWNQVADTFYDRVVPRLINDLENMLGQAPNPPSLENIQAPQQPYIPSRPSNPTLPTVSDRNIREKEPTFQIPSQLDDSSFNLNDLENEAPRIEVREDPTGGFEISNPIDALPDLPSNDFPIPGETDPGEYGQHQPVQEPIEFPDAPSPSEDSGNPIPDNPPIPSDGEHVAPMPGNEFDAPIPDESSNLEGSYYKEHPD